MDGDDGALGAELRGLNKEQAETQRRLDDFEHALDTINSGELTENDVSEGQRRLDLLRDARFTRRANP